MTTAVTEAPEGIRQLRDLAPHFDHVLLDQWGVLHEGRQVFPAARTAVAALQAAGKSVLVLSNSGKRSAENAARLAELGLPPESYSGIVTSGEATWQALRRRDEAPFAGLGRRCFLIVRGGDRSVVEGLELELTAEIGAADFILLAGLDDEAADPLVWQPVFGAALERGLPMLCANPDVKMITERGLVMGPGALAGRYEALGGAVTYIGKPHPPIYMECLRLLGRPDPARVLAVGDSLDHDILGGRRMGMPTLLIGHGVHAAILRDKAPAEMAAAAAELAADDRRPAWVQWQLTW